MGLGLCLCAGALVSAQTTHTMLSDPAGPVCTAGPVASADFAWDAVPSPQTLPLLNHSGSVVWTLAHYTVTLTTPLSLPSVSISVVPMTSLVVSPPAVACVTVQAFGTYPTSTEHPPAAPFNIRIIGSQPPPPPATAQWSTLSAPALLDGRGYFWRLPFDEVNQEFLYYAASSDEGQSSIYSDDLWGINARTGAITRRVTQAGDPKCAILGATFNPAAGHPLGLTWFDPIAKILYLTGQLCVGYNNETTNRYDAQTRTMLSAIPAWPLWPGGSISFDSGITYVTAANRAVLCCGDFQQSTRLIEFDRTTNAYTNVSLLVKGADGIACDYNVSYPQPISTHCPALVYGAATFSDGVNLWILGGQTASGPSVGIVRYDPLNRVMTRIVPTGPLPPSEHGAFPLAFFDSTRSRIVFLARTGELWQYSLATNQWTAIPAAGLSPILASAEPYPHRACGYDAGGNRALCVTSYGQGQPPDLRVLSFQ